MTTEGQSDAVNERKTDDYGSASGIPRQSVAGGLPPHTGDHAHPSARGVAMPAKPFNWAQPDADQEAERPMTEPADFPINPSQSVASPVENLFVAERPMTEPATFHFAGGEAKNRQLASGADSAGEWPAAEEYVTEIPAAAPAPVRGVPFNPAAAAARARAVVEARHAHAPVAEPVADAIGTVPDAAERHAGQQPPPRLPAEARGAALPAPPPMNAEPPSPVVEANRVPEPRRGAQYVNRGARPVSGPFVPPPAENTQEWPGNRGGQQSPALGVGLGNSGSQWGNPGIRGGSGNRNSADSSRPRIGFGALAPEPLSPFATNASGKRLSSKPKGAGAPMVLGAIVVMVGGGFAGGMLINNLAPKVGNTPASSTPAPKTAGHNIHASAAKKGAARRHSASMPDSTEHLSRAGHRHGRVAAHPLPATSTNADRPIVRQLAAAPPRAAPSAAATPASVPPAQIAAPETHTTPAAIHIAQKKSERPASAAKATHPSAEASAAASDESSQFGAIRGGQ